MKIIVGLGNPGDKYKNNRHNVGHIFIDYFLSRHPERSEGSRTKSASLDSSASPQNDILTVKITSFMNNSGQEVKELLTTWNMKFENLIVVHDDLDIPLGKFKIQLGSGPILHNGINSIERELGTKDFWRVRIGVENRSSTNRPTGETYVLSDFEEDEKKLLFTEVFPKLYNEVCSRLLMS